ncbi:MAG: multiprotein-bridging factor 1 family protein [Thermomicrobiales bacterium]
MNARIGGLVKRDQTGNTQNMLTSEQMWAARALLGWKQADLAKKAKVGLATIQRLERGSGALMAHVSTVLKIEGAFTKAGIAFIEPNQEGGIGVRLKR